VADWGFGICLGYGGTGRDGGGEVVRACVRAYLLERVLLHLLLRSVYIVRLLLGWGGIAKVVG